jgi:MFS family permease
MSDIKKTVRTYLFLSIMHKFSISTHFAMYILFLKAQGLNLLEINLVNCSYFVVIFIFEIPTGAFADIFGRKKSYVASCFLWSLSFLTYGLSKTLIGFIIAESIAAVGQTFSSGAFKSWVVDRLKSFEFDGKLEKIFSKEEYLTRGACIIGALIGGFIADVNMIYVWVLGSVLFFLTGIFAIFLMKENHNGNKFSFVDGFSSMKKTVKTSFDYGLKNKTVRFIILVGLIQFFSVQSFNMYWPIYFNQFFGAIKKAGFMWIGISVFLIIGSFSAPFILNIIKNKKKLLMLSQVTSGLFIIILLISNPLFSVIFFLFHELGRGVFDPIKNGYIHENIPSEVRSTIISFESLALHIGGGIGLLISGFIANSFGIKATWLIMGTFFVVFSLLSYLLNKKSKPVS